MNKEEFLASLKSELTNISQSEKIRIINFYSETLEDALEDGMSEEEAIKSLGPLEEILKQIKEDHVGISIELPTNTRQKLYMKRILVFFTCPFWLTITALIVTLYLLYITLLLCNATFILALASFILLGCFQVLSILFANFASGLCLFGCMLFAFGLIPWFWKLLKLGIAYAKTFYYKGISMGKVYWEKAVA